MKPSKPSVLHDCIHLIWIIEGLSTATHAIFDFEGAQNLSGDKQSALSVPIPGIICRLDSGFRPNNDCRVEREMP